MSATYLLVAANDNNGWRVICFDIAHQLSANENELINAEKLDIIRAMVNAKDIETEINKSMNKGPEWASVPSFRAMNEITDIKVDIVDNPSKQLEEWGIEEWQ